MEKGVPTKRLEEGHKLTHEREKPECFFCKEAGEEPNGEVTEFLGLPMCPYHRGRAAEGFEQGMSEQPQHIRDAYRSMSN